MLKFCTLNNFSTSKITFQISTNWQAKQHSKYVILPVMYILHLYLTRCFYFQMVSDYKRISSRQSWAAADMEKAIEAVRLNKMGWLKASKMFNVPQATLRRRAQEKNMHARGVEKRLGRFQKSLTQDMEKCLVNHILDLESRLFGVTPRELRFLAYKLAERSGQDHQFNREKKMASREWLRRFLSRNQSISVRIPEATSAARAQAFNKPQIEKYFNKLQEIIEKENIHPTMIYNMDETGLTTVQKTQKIIAKKGKKQVGAITSAERGIHTTAVVCVSSAGNFVPPGLIFPRKKLNETLYDGAPPGTLSLYNESAYMTGELFLKWIKHFVQYVRPTCNNKVLLILDGHASHKQLESLEFAKQNHVILFCLPSHCTHRLQPLDVAFFGPLTKYYDQEVTTWLKAHPGRTVSIYQIASLFGQAYSKAATVEIALSGFKATGINPLNPNIFPDYLFLPSSVTDILNQNQYEKVSSNEVVTNLDMNQSVSDLPSTSLSNQSDCLAIQLSTSSANQPSTSSAMQHSSSSINIIPDIEKMLTELSPMPIASKASVRRRVKNSYESILTSSPFVNELKGKEAERREKEIRKSNRARVTKRLVESDDEPEPFVNDDEDDSDVPCIYCNDLFSHSRSREKWIRCQQCKQWAHAECAGVSMKIKCFICEACKD